MDSWEQEIINIIRADEFDHQEVRHNGTTKAVCNYIRENFSIPIEPLVIRTNMEYWCEECETLCAVYEQGLSCMCDNGRWNNEKYNEEDYPKKWKKVKVNICSA